MPYPMAIIKKIKKIPFEVGIEYLIEINLVLEVLAAIPSTWLVLWWDFRFLQSVGKTGFPQLLH